ncbi:hypothetical protein FHN55_14650 [Streptomyces sp. NP160]|uniref:Lsr2 family DNA-binding protein n=1 Tax=Streptomyces sp. NP160 TaxID=2586637 RepID=UPI0011198A1F|nr:hypothetical protein FHN55_14650 [Streptomyces sp. NP160]
MSGQPAPADVRAWARSQGLDVSDRGRLSHALVQAYLARPGDGGDSSLGSAGGGDR